MNNAMVAKEKQGGGDSEWSLIDIYYSFFCFVFNSPSPLPVGLSYFQDFRRGFWFQFYFFLLFFTCLGIVVLLAILRALLFLWFPEKHGDLAVVLYMCGDFFFPPYRNHHCFYFNKKFTGKGNGTRKKCGKSLLLIM